MHQTKAAYTEGRNLMLAHIFKAQEYTDSDYFTKLTTYRPYLVHALPSDTGCETQMLQV